MDYLMDVQFHRSMREDLNVTLSRPLDKRALSTLTNLPHVNYVEGLRTVPVRFEAGHRHRDSMILGYPEGVSLRRLLDNKGREHAIAKDGALLTKKLGEILGVNVGDQLVVRVREGDWKTVSVTVAGLVTEPFGLAGHMTQHSLSRLLGDTGPVNTALLSIDTNYFEEVERRLKKLPLVVNVSSPRDFRRQFDEQSVAMMSVFTMIMTVFASIIAVGVIYNNARVALSARSRDLASLRVLGFSQREIATILFGEQAIQVALAIPFGLCIGYYMAVAMMSNVDPETYRLPVMVSTRTYLYAVAVAVASAFSSALLLRRKLQRLDLIGVLKTRE
jgi:putative ABC transport system permease protein